MSELSARLSLPYLLPAQAQKHVTHNEALQRLDLVVQLVVEAFEAAVPPESAALGAIWALSASPSGAWLGQGGKLAAWVEGGWQVITPQNGWQAVGAETGLLQIYQDGAWRAPALGQLAQLGVNTAADTENRLAVAGDAVLLTHAGAGHQLKINKADTADTASVLFQNEWSGRAEFGLAGDDDFHIKVSPDGSTWHEALRIDAGTAALYHGAHQLLHRGAVLGSAVLTAGVPSGGLFEQGSTNSGRYLRLADGTQICWHQLALGSAAAAGAGTFADPYRSASSDWTYPAAFAAAPTVTGRILGGGASALERMLSFASGPASVTSLTGVQAFRGSSHAGSTACSADLIAIGRWA